MKVGTFTKQPGERISKSIVYEDALDEGDYIETVVSCVASPAGIRQQKTARSGKVSEI